MRTVAETPIFIRYASEIWSDAERHVPGQWWLSQSAVVAIGNRKARWGACHLFHSR